ncbi:MAG TPA: hypothetical protein VJZ76_02250 [Thermoanaerobaculia bacterium]|nr:hypothetical protein [Thermoanaerobaculia bacterium]
MSHPDIDALDLAPTAKAAAELIKGKHPDVVFTSGRRSLSEQASAMAANIVSSGNRNWIRQTYAAADALQQWVDANPDVVTKDGIAAGLEATLHTLPDADRNKVSKHLTGQAFDIKPQTANADVIKSDIRELPGLTKFLEREGGLVRWHAQFQES